MIKRNSSSPLPTPILISFRTFYLDFLFRLFRLFGSPLKPYLRHMLWLTPLWFPFTSHGRPSFNCSAIAGSALLDFIFIRPFQLCTRRFGPGLEPLRLLSKLRRASVRDDVAKSRMALFNSRSLANKTFILNDLFLTLQLDVLLLTKPWIHPGELFSFSELLPPDCFFSQLTETSREGWRPSHSFQK